MAPLELGVIQHRPPVPLIGRRSQRQGHLAMNLLLLLALAVPLSCLAFLSLLALLGVMYGLKSDISRGPRSASTRHMHRSKARSLDHLVGAHEQRRRDFANTSLRRDFIIVPACAALSVIATSVHDSPVMPSRTETGCIATL